MQCNIPHLVCIRGILKFLHWIFPGFSSYWLSSGWRYSPYLLPSYLLSLENDKLSCFLTRTFHRTSHLPTYQGNLDKMVKNFPAQILIQANISGAKNFTRFVSSPVQSSPVQWSESLKIKLSSLSNMGIFSISCRWDGWDGYLTVKRLKESRKANLSRPAFQYLSKTGE